MTVAENRIDVLMATYNGAQFLREQIDSIFAQSHKQFRLLVRDDGSSDGTQAMLAELAAARPEAIVLVDPQGPHLGPCGSFARLMEQSNAPYVMFCDQDDVWLPNKIAKMLGHMGDLERQLGVQTPILVHSDLVVVDETLRRLHPSFWAYQRLDPVRGAVLSRLLVENVVAGCAAMANRALVEKCLPIPADAMMHDWWIALAAAALGRLESVPEPLVLYRQHAANRIGTKRPDVGRAVGRMQVFFGEEGFRGHLLRSQRQAQAFLEQFGAGLSSEDRATLELYATISGRGFLARRWLLWRHGFRSASWLGNVKLLAAI
jgi:GT2 family glycosyltransferase